MGAVFVKGRLAVLAHKGTSGADCASDLHIDVSSIIGGVPPCDPLKRSADVVRKYQAQGMVVMVTGHSLGGYMSEVVATNLGLAGVGFCAPGSGWHAGPHGGEGQGFQNVNFENDKYGNVLPGVFAHPQWSVYVMDLGRYEHSMDEMVACMQKRPSWTNRNVVSQCESLPDGYYTCA